MTRAETIDAVVIGGGVIGLAVARALAISGREVVLLEAESAIGMHTSSRNSEVIHAGIYYEPGSLKAELCVRGKHALYDYCEREGVPHSRVGKLIVATRDEQVPELERIKAQAEANGVADLMWLDAGDVRDLEPEVVAERGLFSPSTGIVDSHELMAALRRDATRHGTHIVLSTPVLGARVEDHGFSLEVGGSVPSFVRCTTLVNAAGLFAPSVSRALVGLPEGTIPNECFAKGHYFTLAGQSPFHHLVYPAPEPGGLGIHLTLDLSGQARFGPDVTWVEGVDYRFDEARAATFYTAIRAYYPALADGSLVPGYTGIRPKLVPAGAPAQDFVISGPGTHGLAQFAALYGIESPGMTASLAIAERVRSVLANESS